jgi:hypothetical protein
MKLSIILKGVMVGSVLLLGLPPAYAMERVEAPATRPGSFATREDIINWLHQWGFTNQDIANSRLRNIQNPLADPAVRGAIHNVEVHCQGSPLCPRDMMMAGLFLGGTFEVPFEMPRELELFLLLPPLIEAGYNIAGQIRTTDIVHYIMDQGFDRAFARIIRYPEVDVNGLGLLNYALERYPSWNQNQLFNMIALILQRPDVDITHLSPRAQAVITQRPELQKLFAERLQKLSEAQKVAAPAQQQGLLELIHLSGAPQFLPVPPRGFKPAAPAGLPSEPSLHPELHPEREERVRKQAAGQAQGANPWLMYLTGLLTGGAGVKLYDLFKNVPAREKEIAESQAKQKKAQEPVPAAGKEL